MSESPTWETLTAVQARALWTTLRESMRACDPALRPAFESLLDDCAYVLAAGTVFITPEVARARERLAQEWPRIMSDTSV